ncbi:MAG: radical SAM protein [Nanoarchaeota archaeon]|nr:radical SAM protein [Nanoarchaeota archaeon]
MIGISKELIRRGLKIRWKIGSGTKIETLDKKTISWMAKSGCVYISISPESGSDRVLGLMNKKFDHQLALSLVKYMHNLHITTQACFVLGFPGETDADLRLTRKYVKKITKAGIDEIALFIITPLPGSELFEEFSSTGKKIEELTFSPTWRKDYNRLHKFRKSLYISFLFWKVIYNPRSLLSQFWGFVTRKFKTKMEMTAYRAMKIRYLSLIGGR